MDICKTPDQYILDLPSDSGFMILGFKDLNNNVQTTMALFKKGDIKPEELKYDLRIVLPTMVDNLYKQDLLPGEARHIGTVAIERKDR
jgi:hypothetical protein